MCKRCLARCRSPRLYSCEAEGGAPLPRCHALSCLAALLRLYQDHHTMEQEIVGRAQHASHALHVIGRLLLQWHCADAVSTQTTIRA